MYSSKEKRVKVRSYSPWLGKRVTPTPGVLQGVSFTKVNQVFTPADFIVPQFVGMAFCQQHLQHLLHRLYSKSGRVGGGGGGGKVYGGEGFNKHYLLFQLTLGL